MSGGYGGERPLQRARQALARTGIRPAETAALALLVTGAVAALGMLWVVGRPQPVPPPDAAESGPGVDVQADPLVVAVTGHVASPGLHELPGGARVADALEAAGGPLEGAQLDTVNLARPLSDGEQLIVPGPAPPGPDTGDGGGPPAEGEAAGTGPSARRPDGTLDLNLATAGDLEELPGVGPVLAQRIVEHREANGPFTTIDDLRAVTGIGEKKFAAVADLVSVG